MRISRSSTHRTIRSVSDGTRVRCSCSACGLRYRLNGTTFPPRRPFRRPEGPRAHRQSRAARQDRRRRVHQRAASFAVLRRVGGLRRAPRLHAGRRHPARGLEAVRAHRSLLPEGIRSRHERELLGHPRHLAVDGFLEPRHLEARVRQVPRARASRISRSGSATASAASRSTTTSSRTFRRPRSTSTACCTRSIAPSPSGKAISRCRCRRWPSTSAAAASSSSCRTGTSRPRSSWTRSSRCASAATTWSCSTCSIPSEIDFNFTEAASFQDLETGEQIPVVPTALAAQYKSLVQEHIAALTSRFSQNRVDYTLVNTATPLDYALFKYLSARQRLSRVR